MKKKLLITIGILSLGFLICMILVMYTKNKSYSEKIADYDKQTQFEEFLKELEEKCENGDAEAQYSLGNLYLNGEYVEKDLEKAFYWFSKSATQNNLDALGNLGMMYFQGDYVEKNYDKANELWLRGAELGDSYCLYNIGLNYKEGVGFEKNNEKAYEYIEKAANLGYEKAIIEIKGKKFKEFISRLDNGQEIDGQEINIAINDFYSTYVPLIDYDKLIQESENTELLNYAANIYDNYDGYSEKAFNLYCKSAYLGDDIGILNTASKLSSGEGCEKDLTLAFNLYEIMAEKNNHYGLYEVGLCYLKGEGVTKNKEYAIFYLEKACKQDCQCANSVLGAIYLESKSNPENKDKAKQYLCKAIELGSSDALTVYNDYFDPNYQGNFENKEDTIPIQEHTKQLAIELAKYMTY